MNKKPINYSQCWEDPDILKEALSIQSNDCVLSITSGGDNTLALLLSDPQRLISIDLNIAQNYLLELKKAAAQTLSYEEYLEFLGITKSKNRILLFEKVRPSLPRTTDAWWSDHKDLISIGVVNCGRFERFIISFANYIMPLMHSKRTVTEFLSVENIEEQRNFYRNRWDSKRWRFLFGLASNRLMLKRFARQQGMFTYAKGHTVADIYRKRLERHLNSVFIKGNFFLRYSLTGKYGADVPPYLQKDGYLNLKKSPDSILTTKTTDLLSYLKTSPADTFSKFNLSDIFEPLSPAENDILWQEIIRTAKNGAAVAYWNNLVERSYPERLSNHIQTDEKKVAGLQAKDRVFFYDSFHAHTIIK
jgi:S-adenosylmethionine-diacylglycerol 3-amino-3-carboxypropyl transferase